MARPVLAPSLVCRLFAVSTVSIPAVVPFTVYSVPDEALPVVAFCFVCWGIDCHGPSGEDGVVLGGRLAIPVVLIDERADGARYYGPGGTQVADFLRAFGCRGIAWDWMDPLWDDEGGRRKVPDEIFFRVPTWLVLPAFYDGSAWSSDKTVIGATKEPWVVPSIEEKAMSGHPTANRRSIGLDEFGYVYQHERRSYALLVKCLMAKARLGADECFVPLPTASDKALRVPLVRPKLRSEDNDAVVVVLSSSDPEACIRVLVDAGATLDGVAAKHGDRLLLGAHYRVMAAQRSGAWIPPDQDNRPYVTLRQLQRRGTQAVLLEWVETRPGKNWVAPEGIYVSLAARLPGISPVGAGWCSEAARQGGFEGGERFYKL